jgi:hypothetical protein
MGSERFYRGYEDQGVFHLTIACNNQSIAAKIVECRSDECGMWILSLLRHGSLNATPANALRKVGLSTFTAAAQGPMRRQQK